MNKIAVAEAEHSPVRQQKSVSFHGKMPERNGRIFLTDLRGMPDGKVHFQHKVGIKRQKMLAGLW
jgi:hypothetical protein